MRLRNDLRLGLSADDYDTVLDDFIQTFSKRRFVKSVGSFGEVSEPGISDLDLLMVTEDGTLRRSIQDVKSWRKQSNLNQYLVSHSPLLVTESMMPLVPVLHTLHGLQWHHRPALFPEPTADSKRYLELVWATFLLPIAIRFLEGSNPRSAQRTLHLVKNLELSIRNLTSRRSSPNQGQQWSSSLTSAELRSLVLRSLPVDGGIPDDVSDAIINTLREKFLTLVDALHGYRENEGRHHRALLPFVAPRSRFIVIRSSITRRASTGMPLVLLLDQRIYDRVLGPWIPPKPSDGAGARYRDSLRKAWQLSQHEGTALPFITPFDGNLHRGFYKILVTSAEGVGRLIWAKVSRSHHRSWSK